jgi:hypothetical protein
MKNESLPEFPKTIIALILLLIFCSVFAQKKNLFSIANEFLLDTNVIYVPNTAYDPTTWSPSVAFDGTNYLVVWQDWRNGTDIYGTRVSQSGEVIDPAGIPITNATTARFNPALPAIAFDGNNYLVVWSPGFCTRVNPAGVVLDTNGIRLGSDDGRRSLAFDGTNYLVVWSRGLTGSCDIYGARVSQAGVVLDPNGFPISSAVDDQLSPTVAFDGIKNMVVLPDERNYPEADIYCARVSPDGSVIDTNGICIARCRFGVGGGNGVAFDGTNYMVVWDASSDSSPYRDIYGSRVTPSGVVLDTVAIPIAIATGFQTTPSVAFDGTNYLVVWVKERSYYPYDGTSMGQGLVKMALSLIQ